MNEKIFNKPTEKLKRQILRENSTKAERLLWEKLKSRKLNGHKFRRQFSIGYYVVDFYCPEKRLVIEADGEIHNSVDSKGNDLEREK